MEAGIGKAERDLQIQSVIKSNLISFGLSPEQIEKITLDLSHDIFDVLDEFERITGDKYVDRD